MRKSVKKAMALGMSAAMAVGMLAGCGSSSSDSGSTATEAGSTAEAASSTGEKVLTFGCQNYGDGIIDPANQTNAAWNCTRYGVGECLFKFNDSMEVEGWLADDYTVSDDHLTWTFHIKDGVKFSDGCDVTASAVVASFERLKADGPNGSSTPENYLEYEAELSADDETGTVTIVTKTAYPDLRKNLAYPVMAILDTEHTEDYTRAAIGTGPYVASEYKDQVGYTLVKNEYYYEEVPYDKVELLYMTDASAKAMALQSGQIDLTENITTVSDLENLQADDNYTVTIASGVRCGFSYINEAGILGNDALRQAVLMAIDQETICTAVVAGLYTYGYSVLPSNLAYNYDQLTNPYPYDQEAAAALLDEAGIVDTDGDGIRELDGQNINLNWITYENRCLADFAAAGQQQLAEIGIGATVNSMSSDDEWNKMVNGEYDLCSSNWTTVGTGDPTEYMANWYGASNSNYCSYQNDEYDALYAQLLTELDDDARTDIITQLQQILIDDGAVLVHGYYNSSMLHSKNVGYAAIHTADYYWLTTEITPAE